MGAYGGAAAAQSNIAQNQGNALANIYTGVGAGQAAATATAADTLASSFNQGTKNWLAYENQQQQNALWKAQNQALAGNKSLWGV
jgi:plasmid maintenance system antidote protein VapI